MRIKEFNFLSVIYMRYSSVHSHAHDGTKGDMHLGVRPYTQDKIFSIESGYLKVTLSHISKKIREVLKGGQKLTFSADPL